jgi:hypothetical protein
LALQLAVHEAVAWTIAYWAWCWQDWSCPYKVTTEDADALAEAWQEAYAEAEADALAEHEAWASASAWTVTVKFVT